MTPFGAILRNTVERTPGAVGGSFADSQGEMVDSYTARYDAHDWAVLTAHFGVLLGHVESFLGTWHYGGTEYFVAQHQQLTVVVHTVESGYFAVFAMRRSESPEAVFETLPLVREAALALKREMA